MSLHMCDHNRLAWRLVSTVGARVTVINYKRLVSNHYPYSMVNQTLPFDEHHDACVHNYKLTMSGWVLDPDI